MAQLVIRQQVVPHLRSQDADKEAKLEAPDGARVLEVQWEGLWAHVTYVVGEGG